MTTIRSNFLYAKLPGLTKKLGNVRVLARFYAPEASLGDSWKIGTPKQLCSMS